MFSLPATFVAIVVLAILLWRRGRDRRVRSSRPARWLRIAALIPLGLQVAVYLLFGIGEMAGGDLSGAGHLVQVAAPVLLAALAWMRPLEAGVALLVVGVVTSIIRPGFTGWLIMAAPHILSGVLFLIAGILARRATPPGSDEGR